MPSHKSNLSRSHRLIERKNRRVFILLASESISFHFSTIKLKRCHSVGDGMVKVWMAAFKEPFSCVLRQQAELPVAA